MTRPAAWQAALTREVARGVGRCRPGPRQSRSPASRPDPGRRRSRGARAASALQPGEHHGLDPPGLRRQVLLLDGGDGAERGGAGHRVAAVGPPRPPACTESMISARPVTPASGRPPAMPLAVVIRSGTTPSWSHANRSPVRAKPLWISSATNRTPLARAPVGQRRQEARARARRSRPRPGSARSRPPPAGSRRPASRALVIARCGRGRRRRGRRVSGTGTTSAPGRSRRRTGRSRPCTACSSPSWPS